MKTRQKKIPDDPVIEELRHIRRELWKEAGEDVTKYMELVRREASEVRKNQQKQSKKDRKA